MDKFDEYTFFAESTQHLSERRQAATGTYLTVNTALFAVLAFLVKEAGLGGGALVVMLLPLFLVGLAACATWLTIVSQYRKLIGWRYDQLMAMEDTIADCHQMYRKEWQRYYSREAKSTHGLWKSWFEFSELERLLPIMFLTLYLLYGAALMIDWLAGLGWVEMLTARADGG